MAFAHGSGDVANGIGPMAAVIQLAGRSGKLFERPEHANIIADLSRSQAPGHDRRMIPQRDYGFLQNGNRIFHVNPIFPNFSIL